MVEGHKPSCWQNRRRRNDSFVDFQSIQFVFQEQQWIVRVNDVEDEEEYNQYDEVPFFMDTRRINIIETKISYSNVIPYARTDGEGKLVHV
jgi:glycosylphosphatidylinositol transamidase (GPIT) subunit GPI8